MNTINKILTYIAIVCVLIMATMGVVSAGSWSDSYGQDEGTLYKPYAPIDRLMFVEKGNDVRYTLKLDDRFYAFPNYEGYGTTQQIAVNLTGEGEDNYIVYITVQYIPLSNGNYAVRYTIPVNQLPGFGLTEGWELKAVSENVIIEDSKTSTFYLPYFNFLGMGSNFVCNYGNNTTVRYYHKSSSGNSFDESNASTQSYNWSQSDISGYNYLFRYPDAYDMFYSQNTSSKLYTNNGMMWVDESTTTITSDYEITGVQITIPFVQADTIVPFSSYLSYFDLGRYETQQVIETSIVTVPTYPDSDYESQYTSFTDWLIVAVGGFMDFGFWGISIGAILGTIILFKLIKALLDYFSGG